MVRKKNRIKIDYFKCRDPENCRKCLAVCTPGVLNLTFRDEDYHDPKDWIILPVFYQLCDFCKKCVEICPEKAITIKN